jgi:hypothetical protein
VVWCGVVWRGVAWCGVEAGPLLCLRLARSRSPKPPGFGAGEATRKLIMRHKPTAAPFRQPGLRASPRFGSSVWQFGLRKGVGGQKTICPPPPFSSSDRLLCLRLARSRSPKPPGFGAGEATRKLVMRYKPTAAPLRQPGLRASPRFCSSVWQFGLRKGVGGQ